MPEARAQSHPEVPAAPKWTQNRFPTFPVVRAKSFSYAASASTPVYVSPSLGTPVSPIIGLFHFSPVTVLLVQLETLQLVDVTAEWSGDGASYEP